MYSLQTTILEKCDEAKQLFCGIFVEMVKGFDIDVYIELGLPLLLTPIEVCQNKLVKFLISSIGKSYASKLIDRVEYLVTTPELDVNIVYKALLEHIERKIVKYNEKYKDYNKALNEIVRYMKNRKSEVKSAVINDIVKKSFEDLKVISILKELIYKHSNNLLSMLGNECLDSICEVVNRYYYLAKKQRTH